MAKQNPIESLQGWLIIIGIFILSAIFGFLEFSFWVTIFLIVISVVVIGGLFSLLKFKWKNNDADLKNQASIKYNINDYPGEIPFFLVKALESEANGDFLSARISYLQAVESLKTRCPQNEYNKYIDSLQEMYDEFVLRDPYYKKLMKPLLTIIKDNNGILQSQITKQFETSDWSTLKCYNRPVLKDDIYYALYFADRFGHIVRIKKGRSYLLYLPGTQLIADEIVTEE